MSRDVMKLALEALDGIHPGNMTPMAEEYWNKAITALKTALAEQPAQQEPEWYHFVKHGEDCFVPYRGQAPENATPLYTSPPAQEPVAFLANGTRFKISYDSRQSGGQIHGIPPELGGRWVAFVAADDDCHLKLTSPPAQRTWVGLTDEEIEKLTVELRDIPVTLAFAIEAKLKEKNT